MRSVDTCGGAANVGIALVITSGSLPAAIGTALATMTAAEMAISDETNVLYATAAL